MNTTSVSLLERLRLPGQTEAWTRFVQLYTPLLHAWVRRLGMNSADVGDLVQEVFALLVQKLPAFHYDRRLTFRGWLWTVTLNKWREERRRQKGQPNIQAHANLGELPGPEDESPVAEAEYRQYLVSRALQLMESEFQPTSWKACLEHVVSGRPAAAVAAELGISEGAVYVAKHRVLRRLREELRGLID